MSIKNRIKQIGYFLGCVYVKYFKPEVTIAEFKIDFREVSLKELWQFSNPETQESLNAYIETLGEE